MKRKTILMASAVVAAGAVGLSYVNHSNQIRDVIPMV